MKVRNNNKGITLIELMIVNCDCGNPRVHIHPHLPRLYAESEKGGCENRTGAAPSSPGDAKGGIRVV